MPVLSNAKHELFCQHLALGKTASEAYELAGYKPSRSNASVLRAKQNVSDRLRAKYCSNLREQVVQQIVEYTRDSISLAELEEARQAWAIELQEPFRGYGPGCDGKGQTSRAGHRPARGG